MESIGCVGESIRVVEANRRNEAIRRDEDDEFKMEEGAPRFGFCLEWNVNNDNPMRKDDDGVDDNKSRA